MHRFPFKPFVALSVSFLLGGCAAFHTTPLHPGDPEAHVVAVKGNPTHRYQLDRGYLLEYARGPMGQETYMARFNAAGKLISYEQVLTDEKFASIEIGKFTGNDVLRTIGATSRHSYMPLSRLEVWSYAYRENGIWDSVMHVYFDQVGIVRKLESTPDPRSPLRGGAPGMPGR